MVLWHCGNGARNSFTRDKVSKGHNKPCTNQGPGLPPVAPISSHLSVQRHFLTKNVPRGQCHQLLQWLPLTNKSCHRLAFRFSWLSHLNASTHALPLSDSLVLSRSLTRSLLICIVSGSATVASLCAVLLTVDNAFTSAIRLGREGIRLTDHALQKGCFIISLLFLH